MNVSRFGEEVDPLRPAVTTCRECGCMIGYEDGDLVAFCTECDQTSPIEPRPTVTVAQPPIAPAPATPVDAEDKVVLFGFRVGDVVNVKKDPTKARYTIKAINSYGWIILNDNDELYYNQLVLAPAVPEPAAPPQPAPAPKSNGTPLKEGGLGAKLRQARAVSATAPAQLNTDVGKDLAKARLNPPHVIVQARAGTGKTFTLVVGVIWTFRNRVPGLWEELLRRVRAERRDPNYVIEPSPQQQAVWDQMGLSEHARTVQFTAFNKSIVKDFESKWGWVTKMLADHGIQFGFNTMHSLGNKAVYRAFGRLEVNEYRTDDIICRLMNVDIRELRKTSPVLLKATRDLVGLCKLNLIQPQNEVTDAYGPDAAYTVDMTEQLAQLAAHYDVDLVDGERGGKDWSQEVFALVPQVLSEARNPRRDGCIDFNDMIWLPVVLDLPVFKNDVLLVDEGQDLGRAQQELAKKAGNRLLFVGDDRQAIYGFAGADTISLNRLKQHLLESPRGCVVLPLTMTRRCGRAIVEEAQQVVPDFEAHPTNGAGEVAEAKYPLQWNGSKWDGDVVELPLDQTYIPLVQDGDFVLCRVNAPLVSQCFKFLRLGRKATIQGRDVGKGLEKMVKAVLGEISPSLPIADFLQGLSDYHCREVEKEQAKRNPSESRIMLLNDRYSCLVVFSENATTAQDVLNRIDRIFTDNRNEPGVRFSSIHRAKGMEAKRVFFIRSKDGPCPHPMAKRAWQKEQELNCLYIAITRAVEKLTYVY